MSCPFFTRTLLFFALAVMGVFGAEQPFASTNQSSFLLEPARVFDSEDGKTQEGWSVLVTNNHIAAVGPTGDVKVPGDAVKIPLAGMTLLPGLMDIHSHIFL